MKGNFEVEMNVRESDEREVWLTNEGRWTPNRELAKRYHSIREACTDLELFGIPEAVFEKRHGGMLTKRVIHRFKKGVPS